LELSIFFLAYATIQVSAWVVMGIVPDDRSEAHVSWSGAIPGKVGIGFHDVWSHALFRGWCGVGALGRK
jgi:hypothetical protein